MALIAVYLFENSREPLPGPLDSARSPPLGDDAVGQSLQKLVGTHLELPSTKHDQLFVSFLNVTATLPQACALFPHQKLNSASSNQGARSFNSNKASSWATG